MKTVFCIAMEQVGDEYGRCRSDWYKSGRERALAYEAYLGDRTFDAWSVTTFDLQVVSGMDPNAIEQQLAEITARRIFVPIASRLAL
jgi:hypothetical protein